MTYRLFAVIVYVVGLSGYVNSQEYIRQYISLNDNWYTIANDTNKEAYTGFEAIKYNTSEWELVDVPHNWDKYEGYRRMLHGNRHGYAWYRKTFNLETKQKDKRYFLFFEGVGSYATVWLNGKEVGSHAGGRTTFTFDVTDAIKAGKENILAVRADHPAEIRDLPWVCGGCSDEIGFSEGSQPMGIFRPVQLIITSDVRIEPFGIHIWNDTTVSEANATLNMSVEVKNYTSNPREISIINKLIDKKGRVVSRIQKDQKLAAGELAVIPQEQMEVSNPNLWSIEDPYLYTIQTEILEDEDTLDLISTKYGIRWISWPIYRNDGDNRFYLNGKPVFINGTAEYEHNLGQSHAFTPEQIRTRVMQMKAAGFNAFRDAHQPHNLRYQANWDSLGMLFWTQMAAHIWFDNPEFKKNFKQLLRDFVKERRNCPSVILWGLENESTLPTEFAEECTEIIREMDPTTSSQRLVTTCNGGTGTDWNVIQNWSGTYAGELYEYDKDISRELLNGEYGAWRSLDLHTEGPFERFGVRSENRMCQLMETKVLLAEKAKDECCGQFQWIFNTHDNPGRTQNGEGLRELDRIGPANYKGLITHWGEPADVYYMYRANYAPKETEPMVYIVSHTWPNRWINPGIKDSITIYSNCDEVELFNGLGIASLGIKTREGIGTHFRWNNVDIQYNVLYAVGYINHQIAASDLIVLHHLPKSPKFDVLSQGTSYITLPKPDYNYVYRVNCGGPEYIDKEGFLWLADQHKENSTMWGSLSWTDDFPGLPPFYASQRRTFDPIEDTDDWALFQTFRYGRDKLKYIFPLPNGEYLVELYFTEPWYGTGGGLDCEGWRIFDVAINGETIIEKLDIWKEAGHDRAMKKTAICNVKDEYLTISFPKMTSGQAIVSAIAIASKDSSINLKPEKTKRIKDLAVNKKAGEWIIKSWMDIGDKQYIDDEVLLRNLPSNFYGSTWLTTNKNERINVDTIVTFTVTKPSDVFICMDSRITNIPVWMKGYVEQKSVLENGNGDIYKVYAKRFPENSIVVLGPNGINNETSTKMYTTVVNPVYNLGQASDQRPVKQYQAEEARLIGKGLKKDTFRNRDYILYERETGDTIVWEFTVGLGDTYTLDFRYLNNTDTIIPMQVLITDVKGLLVKDDIIEFTPRKDSWRSLKITTGTSINAGSYNVWLLAVGSADLGIDRLDIQ